MEAGVRKERKMAKDTICWICSRALPGNGCPWSNYGQPVPGWAAKHRYISANIGFEDTYCVFECPLFHLEERLRCVTCENCIAGCKGRQICADFISMSDQIDGLI